MKYLIDTHIFLWLLYQPQKLDTQKINILQNSENDVYISSLSFWEISLKFALGKLDISGVKPDELPDLAKRMGIEILEITTNEMASSYKLEKVKNHKDPFDRAMIWQSISNNLTMVNHDNKFSEYEKLGLKLL